MEYLKQLSGKFIVISLICLTACTNKNEQHIVEWKGTDESGQTASLVFDKTNHAIFVIGNTVLGGKEFQIDGGIKGEVKYEIDYTKDPIWLDIVIS